MSKFFELRRPETDRSRGGASRHRALRVRHAATTPFRRWKKRPRRAGPTSQNQYQRRADLIPNLVATVQGYAAQEKNVLTAVVEARAKATQVKVDASQLTDPDKLKAFQDAQNQLSGALGRLLAVSENYPDLKSNANFLALQSQLEGTENRIAVARRDYIEAVRTYNTALRTFPTVLWAKTAFSGNKPMAEFTATAGAEKPPAGEILMMPAVITRPEAPSRSSGSGDGFRVCAPRARNDVCSPCDCSRLRPVARALDFPALTGRVVDQAGVMSAESRERRRGEVERAGRQVRHPARRRHGEVAARQRHRNLRQPALPLLEARRGEEEQRRAAPRRAGRAQSADRGRLRPRRHADRCAVVGDHFQRHRAAFKSGDFSGGIERGVDGIIAVLSGDAAEWQRKVPLRQDDNRGDEIFAVCFLLFVIAIVVGGMIVRRKSGHYVTRHGRRVFVAAAARRAGAAVLQQRGAAAVLRAAVRPAATSPEVAAPRAAAARRETGDGAADHAICARGRS